MQLPRVIIAAVFFIIGALIAIPALTSGGGSHDSSRTAASTTASPSVTLASPTPSAHASSGHPSGTPNPHGATTRPATPKTSLLPTHLPTAPATSGAPATAPLSSTVSAVSCPAREVRVSVVNKGATAQDYVITQNGSVVLANRIGPEATQSNSVTLKEGVRTKVTVLWNDHAIHSVSRTAQCKASPTKTPKGGQLPFTGTNSASLYAKIATGVAAMITGVIIFWWGGVWPRRRESMFGADGGVARRRAKSKDRISF